jgi:outer membrane immunogenic protein
MKIIAKFLTAAAIAVVASSASAADLRPAYKAAPAMPVAYNWSGFYLGGHVGYGWGDLNANIVGLTGSRDIDGFFGGGQIGWNWQAAGSPWVWGFEADISVANIEDSVTTAGITFSSDADLFGTARLRLGYAVDRALWYVTGGLAWVNNEVSLGVAGVGAVTSSNTHIGWTIGGGLEFALADAWTAKIEYLYVDTSSENYFTTLVGPGIELDPDFHTVRIGLNYRFGGVGKGPVGKGPVVAKY